MEQARRLLAEKPDGVLEEVARAAGVPYRAVLDLLDPGQAVQAPGSAFEEIWQELSAWPGEVTFIVHTLDGVFETRGAVPPGTHGRGFFNIHGDSPLGGHVRADRCAAVYFVDRLFFGRRSCSVQFVNLQGETMFKVFVGRDAERALDPRQVRRFEEAVERLSAVPA